MRGKECTKDLIESRKDSWWVEISPISDVRSSNYYRNRLVETILKKILYEEF